MCLLQLWKREDNCTQCRYQNRAHRSHLFWHFLHGVSEKEDKEDDDVDDDDESLDFDDIYEDVSMMMKYGDVDDQYEYFLG